MMRYRKASKSVLVCLILILLINSGGAAFSLSDPTQQSSCGQWNVDGFDTSYDGRMGIKLLTAAGKECKGHFSLNNNTEIISNIGGVGGYTLELAFVEQNASYEVEKLFGLIDPNPPFLYPFMDFKIEPKPIDISSEAHVTIYGGMTFAAYVNDIALLIIMSAVDYINPIPCMPFETLVLWASQLSFILIDVGQEMLSGDFSAAFNEFKRIEVDFTNMLFELIADSGLGCIDEKLLTNVKIPWISFIWRAFVWQYAWWEDYLGTDWQNPARVSVVYDPKTANIPEKTPTPIGGSSGFETKSSASVFLIDTSGSMNEEDITGYSKMEAAQKATRSILDVIKTENMSGLSYLHQVGLVSFENTATLGVDLTTDLTSVESGIDRLYAYGGTGMADGLRLAIDMLSPVDPTYNKMTILLSDGMPNVGLNSNNYLTEYEIIDELINLASEAKSKGICVHTIGFGLPGQIGGVSGQASINEDLLRQIASGSGCGNYYNASNAIELANAFIEIRHASLGQILLNQEGVISQDEVLDLGSVPVVDDQELILITLNWPGSQLDLELTDPAGVIVDSNYPNANVNTTSSLISMAVTEPMAGNWRVKVFGADIPEGQTDYKVLFSARLKPELPVEPAGIKTDNIPTPSGLSAILVVVLIATSVILVTKYSGSKKKGTTVNTTSQAWLIRPSSSAPQNMIPLSKNFIIGRRSTASLHLDSSDISRDHAQIYFSGGKWYIHDMNSRLGTYVNGHAIKISPLSSGDKITIGKDEWIFHIKT